MEFRLKPNKYYRVIKDGATLDGMKAIAPSCWRTITTELKKGDKIMFLDWVSGWGSDPGPDEPKFSMTDGTSGIFHPQKGIWDAAPEDGFLELE